MKPIYHHLWLLLILSLYLILGVVMSVVVPLGEAPDELDHFLYVEHLVREQAFPVLDPVFANNETLEANQPPLYYLLGAFLTNWVERDTSGEMSLNTCFSYEPDDPGRQTFYRHDAAEQWPWRGTVLAFHLVRLLSVGLGAGTVGLAYAIGRAVMPDDKRVGWAAAAILAFNPQFLFITASANNDNLTAFMGAAIVLASLKLAQSPIVPSPRRVIPVSALIGLGLLTKFSLLGLWPLPFLALLLIMIKRNNATKIATVFKTAALWQAAALLLIVPLLIAGWWYGRAAVLYGDPLAWEVHLAAKGAYVLRTEPLRLADLFDFARTHFQSYWGWFGWLNIKWPMWVYWGLVGMVAAAVVGFFRPNGKNPKGWSTRAMLFPTLATAIVYLSLLRYIQTINWSGYQGRLAFTAAAPIAILLAVGLAKLGGVRLAQGVGAALFGLSVGTLLGVIAPAYARPQIYQPAPHTVTFANECARFEGGLELEAYHVDEPLVPGATVPITLVGYGLADSSRPQTIRVQITGREDQVVGQAETALTWMAGQVISVTLDIVVDAAAAPSRALLQAGLLAEDGTWQTATSPGGRVLDVPLNLAPIKISPVESVVARPQISIEAEFGDMLRLLGYDLIEHEDTVTITWYWQAAATMSTDYTFFTHLQDSNGQIVAQQDSQPQGGWYPTSLWAKGEIVTETVVLTRPQDALTNHYQLAVGVYQLATLERLPVMYQANNQPDNQLILPLGTE